jgi:hypothetical protein
MVLSESLLMVRIDNRKSKIEKTVDLKRLLKLFNNLTELYHEHPPSIFIDAMVSETSSITICIAHFNGVIQKLVLRTSDTSSVLAPLIALTDGTLITFEMSCTHFDVLIILIISCLS